MHDTAAHVQMVKKRIHQRQRTHEKHSIYSLSTLCVLLSALLVGMTSWFSGGEQMIHIGMYGSMLLHENAGGYVLVGVVTFTAAVIITVLCIRYAEKNRREPPEEDER